MRMLKETRRLARIRFDRGKPGLGFGVQNRGRAIAKYYFSSQPQLQVPSASP